MKQFLLLAAIYSLVIHQSQKNSREAGTELQQFIKKDITTSVHSNARIFAYNSICLGSGALSRLILPEEAAFVKWAGKK